MIDASWTDEAVRRAIAKVPWYHSFEIVPGIVTPGGTTVDARRRLGLFDLPEDLRGARALDIGTWDGPVAFELERRGATVTALDIHDPDCTGFNTAKAILGSRVDYVRSDVVQMRSALEGTYDLVIFCGVFYHLKNPIGAFDSIAGVMHGRSVLCLEGEVLVHYAEADGAADASLPLAALADSRVPIALCYPGLYKQAANWFIPNVACLESWLEAAGLKMVSHRLYSRPESTPFPTQRVSGTARKVAAPREEHPILDEDRQLVTSPDGSA